jgi:2'-5' RNA ligase
MALLAISYPSISDADRQWIQQIRQQHDPNYAVVDPHFTLIFPTFERAPAAFCEHVRTQTQEQPPIAIALRCALVVKDALSDATHTFLVPDQGFSDLVKLHDRLYTHFLADQLRLDIPFIPHITVATSLDAAVCKRIAGEINQQNLAISGWIRTLDLVEFSNRTVATLEQVTLA